MALIPPGYLNTVVALRPCTQDKNSEYSATGFLFGSPVEDNPGTYRLFLVTNRHVIDNIPNSITEIEARFNMPVGSGSKTYPLALKPTYDSYDWFVHPDEKVDVAVKRLNANVLKEGGHRVWFFASDRSSLTREQVREWGVSEGDGVFALGFPLGIAGKERNYTIVRQGIIARIQDWLNGDEQEFLIDSSIYPGNSGGPVVLKPEISSIEGTKSNRRCVLIGMVAGYLPYEEVAISPQTMQTRVVFQENSGLGVIVPVDAIQETIQIALKDSTPQEQEQSSSETEG